MARVHLPAKLAAGLDSRVASLVDAGAADGESPDGAAAPVPGTGTVRIDRLILHHLDNARGTLRLVDEPVALDERSAAFFAGHLDAAARRADWRARFADAEGEAAALCRRLAVGPEEFVAASQRLAERLYAQMRLRPNQITPGDFVVIAYQHGDRPHLALLKLDPDQRLVRRFSRVGEHTRVTIQAADNLLPEARMLQKCALLRDAAGDFEVTLLDTQAGPRSDGVAAFFYRGFLAVTLAPSARRRTRLFLTASDTWISRHGDALAPPQLLRFYRARRAALGGDVLDLIAFVADALPEDASRQGDLLAHLVAALFDRADGVHTDGPRAASFAVDRATADPVVRYVTLELDGGARLRVEAARFAALVRVAETRRDGKIRLVIDTLTASEVSGA